MQPPSKRARFTHNKKAEINLTELSSLSPKRGHFSVQGRVTFRTLTSVTSRGEPMVKLELLDHTQAVPTKITIMGKAHVDRVKTVQFMSTVRLHGLRCTLWQEQVTLLASEQDPFRVTSLSDSEAQGANIPEALPVDITRFDKLNEDETGNVNLLVRMTGITSQSATCEDAYGTVHELTLPDEPSCYPFEIDKAYCIHRALAKRGKITVWAGVAGVEDVSDDVFESCGAEPEAEETSS